MKLCQILFSILLVCSLSLADEEKPVLADFVLPVPADFATSATSAMKASEVDLAFYFKAMGIMFPVGAKVDLDCVKGVITARLTHQEALRVIQIINAFIGDSSGKLSREVFIKVVSSKEPPENE